MGLESAVSTLWEDQNLPQRWLTPPEREPEAEEFEDEDEASDELDECDEEEPF